MAPALVSIVIPCHNAAAWLSATLESALGQTWSPCEIIVVDDGSKDDSLAIARGFCERGVTVIAQSNRGASAARNAALRASCGAWIQFLDADDLLAPDKIERQLTAPAAQDPGFLLAGRWARFCGSTAEARFAPEILDRDATPVDWLVLKMEHHAMMHPAAWLCPRALVDSAGPWDEGLSLDDDGEYFARLVLNSAGVRHCPGAISYYRSQMRGSLSRSNTVPAWSSALRSLEATSRRLLARENSARTRLACATAAQRLSFEAYPAAPAVWSRARQLAAQWGGSPVRPFGGPKFQLLSRLVGWRLARRIQARFAL